MTTDRAPQDMLYLSERLVQDIVDQHESTIEYEVGKLHVSGPLLRAEFGRTAASGNSYRLAKIAREATRDHTGTVDAPGVYLHVTGVFMFGEVPVLGGGYRVAWFSGVVPTAAGAPVLVALVGTLHNYVGRKPDDGSNRGGAWYPSSVQGLNEMFAAFSKNREEPDHVPTSLSLDDAESATSIAHAIHTTLGGQFIMDTREVEVFARVCYDLDNGQAESSAISRTIIGCPLVVQTPPPAIDRRVLHAQPEPPHRELTAGGITTTHARAPGEGRANAWWRRRRDASQS